MAAWRQFLVIILLILVACTNQIPPQFEAQVAEDPTPTREVWTPTPFPYPIRGYRAMSTARPPFIVVTTKTPVATMFPQSNNGWRLLGIEIDDVTFITFFARFPD